MWGFLTRPEYKFPFCLLPKLQNNLSVSAQAQISLQCWCLFVLSKSSNDICTIIKYLEDWLDSGALKTNPLKYFIWQEMKQELKRRNKEKVIIQYLIFTKHQLSQRPIRNWSKSCWPKFTAEGNGRIWGMYRGMSQVVLFSVVLHHCLKMQHNTVPIF